MLAAHLQRFVPYSTMDEHSLALAAASARTLKLPPGRWLTRPGRTLPGAYYLLRGRVRTHRPDGEISDNDARARQPIVPGALAVKTLAATSLLVVHSPHACAQSTDQEPNVASKHTQLDLLLPRRLEPGWEHRFLRHQVLRPLGPRQWQKILRGMQGQAYAAGDNVVVQGEPGAHFFVLSSGIAGVLRGNQEVARLYRGDFFGEEALVLGAPRNATVTMLCAGRVMALPGEVFLTEMLAHLLAGNAAAESIPLRIGGGVVGSRGYVALAQLRDYAAGLDRRRSYRVEAATPAEAVLGAFLLRQAGVAAEPDGDAMQAYFS